MKHLILGPPGTGKTTTLLDKVDELLQAGVEPQRIAYVSFTRKAADEAAERACERFDLSRKDFRNFKTLHAMAFRELGLSRSDVIGWNHWRELSEITGYKLRPNVSLDDGLMTASGTHGPYLFHLNLARITCRELRAHWDYITQPDLRQFYLFRANKDFGYRDFEHLHREITKYKEARGVLEFTDMLDHGQHLPALDVDYAIIDEAQDLSRLQWRFAKAMFGNTKDVWIAGDDDQAIYQWAGADLYTFRHMEAQREVLAHSWRLPISIHKFAARIAAQIRDRYEKAFTPREDEGLVQRTQNLSELPLGEEDWLMLTRTRAQQADIVEHLRRRGYLYEQHGKSSFKQEHEVAIRAWTRLSQGGQVNGDQVRSIYAWLKTGSGVERGFKKQAEELDADAVYDEATLREQYGLRAQGPWYETLERLPDDDVRYYRELLSRGEDVDKPDRIKVSTIHGVKGGEADNVYMSTNLGPTAHRAATQFDLDPELRVLYVGATRAKKRLYVKNDAKHSLPVVRHALTCVA